MANVSRRSFVELVTGTLVSLPTLAGGMVLAPRPANADPDPTDDSEMAGQESEYVIIDVVRAWETGFMVVDITKPEELESGLLRYPPVAGATVTVTSRFSIFRLPSALLTSNCAVTSFPAAFFTMKPPSPAVIVFG